MLIRIPPYLWRNEARPESFWANIEDDYDEEGEYDEYEYDSYYDDDDGEGYSEEESDGEDDWESDEDEGGDGGEDQQLSHDVEMNHTGCESSGLDLI